MYTQRGMGLRVHHINCGTLCPLAARSIDGVGSMLARGKMVCHCALIETAGGLVLVDTGLGTADCADPRRFSLTFRRVAGARFDPEETAVAQVRRLGFDPKDVRHVVVTHLDLDHAGGLPDFPWATVHLHQKELDAATQRRSLKEKERYLTVHFAHGPKWKPYSEDGEDWFGLKKVRLLDGLDDFGLVPLFGHTRGHTGVAFKDGDRWSLHAGDAYFFHGELEDPPRCPWGLAGFQSLMAIDDEQRRENSRRLGVLARTHASAVSVFSAHDPVELRT